MNGMLRVVIVDDNEEALSARARIIDQPVDMELIAAASGVDEGVA